MLLRRRRTEEGVVVGTGSVEYSEAYSETDN
jgi:hypothetical protein